MCIRGKEAAGGSVAEEQVSEIGGGMVMKGFVGEKDFKLDVLGNREPLKVLEDRSDEDVVMNARVGEETGSRVLNVLKFIHDFG